MTSDSDPRKPGADALPAHRTGASALKTQRAAAEALKAHVAAGDVLKAHVSAGQAVTDALKVRQNLLRRMAARQGLRLEKSRTRDQRAVDYGTYRLVQADTGELQSWGGGPYGYGLSIEQIEKQLQEGTGPFYRAERGHHIDAEAGSLITVKAGAILDMAGDHGRRFLAMDDGSLIELHDYQEWLESAADERMAEPGDRVIDRPLTGIPKGVQARVTLTIWDEDGPAELEFTARAPDGIEYRTIRQVSRPPH